MGRKRNDLAERADNKELKELCLRPPQVNGNSRRPKTCGRCPLLHRNDGVHDGSGSAWAKIPDLYRMKKEVEEEVELAAYQLR